MVKLSKGQEVNISCSGPKEQAHEPCNLFSTLTQFINPKRAKKATVALGCRNCFKDPNGRPSYKLYRFPAKWVLEALNIEEEEIDDNDIGLEVQAEGLEGSSGTENSGSGPDEFLEDKPTKPSVPIRRNKRVRKDIGSDPPSQEIVVQKRKRGRPKRVQ